MERQLGGLRLAVETKVTFARLRWIAAMSEGTAQAMYVEDHLFGRAEDGGS
jgi:hypothetical protein